MIRVLALFVIALFVSGCGTLNNTLVEKEKTVELYRIFDIKTLSDSYEVSNSASNGLGRNVNNAKEVRPIPNSAELPSEPGRFSLVNPFEGSKFAAFAAAGGNLGMKVATCENASWSAQASRTISGHSKLNLTACLFPYKEGFHLNLYSTYTKKEGGLMELSRQAANAMVGTPEEWAEKTFLDIVRQIREDTGANITFLEGYPKMNGTPWLDGDKTVSSLN